MAAHHRRTMATHQRRTVGEPGNTSEETEGIRPIILHVDVNNVLWLVWVSFEPYRAILISMRSAISKLVLLFSP